MPHKFKDMGYKSILKISWPLLIWDALVGMFISADYINLLFLSNLLWPGEPFHALQMGALITVRLWVDGVAALFWGYLVDRFPRKKLWSVTSMLTGIFIFGNGLLPVGNGDQQFLYWLLLRGATGLFMSCGGPMIFSLVSDLLEKEQRSRFFGLEAIIWGVVPSLFSLISAIIFQLNAWRWYYAILGILYMLFGLFIRYSFKEPKRGVKEPKLTQILTESATKYDYILTKETIRSTLFSKTNILVFAEGIFTNIFFGILDLVLLPYIQDSPRNLSSTNSAILSLSFGLPGAIIGPLVFGKLADRWGKKDIRNRILMIIISISGGFFLVSSFFFIQIPELSMEQGQNIAVLWQNSGFIVYGIVILLAKIVFSMFAVNQPPIIQEINLPEAQGTIRSWGQLVEIVSYGFGPLLAGFLLTQYDNNYQAVIIRMVWLLLPGIIMWLLTLKTVRNDQAQIQELLIHRSKELIEKK